MVKNKKTPISDVTPQARELSVPVEQMSHIFLSGLKPYKTSKELLNAGKLPDVTTTDNS